MDAMDDRANILIVDDELGPRESLKMILKPYYNVYATDRGSEAIRLVGEIPVDLVTVDLKMPGLPGTKVLQKIKEQDPDIEAIIITDYGSMDTAVEGLRLGAFDYISKPFDVNHILALIRRALQRRIARLQLRNVRSEFMANISHELRTPLSVVIGFVSILLDQLVGDVTEGQRSVLEKVYKNSGELLELVDNVLIITSLNSGELIVTEEEFDVCLLLRECARRYEKLADEKGMGLVIEGPQDRVMILGDPNKTGRIVQNLLHNAIKFTPAGRVTIKVQMVPQKGMVEIEIRDTGVGMPEDQIDRLFQPFQQLDSSMRREFSGLGLGLTAARRLTEFLGGSLKLRSERGVGTEALLSLPSRALPERSRFSTHRL